MRDHKLFPTIALTAALLALGALLLAACGPAQSVSFPAVPAAATDLPVAVVTLIPAPTEMAVEDDAPVTPTSVALTPQSPAITVVPTSVAAGQQLQAPTPEGWLAMEDPARRYSLAYPPGWSVCQKTKYTLLFCGVEEDPLWNHTPQRLYTSAVPLDYNNEDFEAYNFVPLEIVRRFAALKVGESMSKVPGSQMPGYTTYTRLPDRTVAGYAAAVLESPRVWEAPAETKDRVAFIITDSAVYMIGMYYETPEQLAAFEQVLDSFKIGE